MLRWLEPNGGGGRAASKLQDGVRRAYKRGSFEVVGQPDLYGAISTRSWGVGVRCTFRTLRRGGRPLLPLVRSVRGVRRGVMLSWRGGGRNTEACDTC